MDAIKSTKRTYTLLVFLVIAAGFYWYQTSSPPETSRLALAGQIQYPHATASTGHSQVTRTATRNDLMQVETISMLRKILFVPKGFGHVTAPVYPAKPWQRTEIERHKTGLAEHHYDYIMMPVEENIAENDRVGRLMSAGWVARAIEQSSGKRVMPPELTLRLLGGSATRFQDQAVFEIAGLAGANIIYLLYDNHFPTNKQNRLMAVLTNSSGNIKQRSIQNLAKAVRGQPLEGQVAEMATAITADLMETQPVQYARKTFHLDKTWAFPEQLTDLLQPNQTALQHAANLQLVAMLTPQWLEYERRRLFERSLYAMNSVKPDSDEYNLLMARAQFYLTRRPVAMSYLDQARSPAEVALQEYLNGNYPEMLAAIPKIKRPVLQAIAYIELGQLSYVYNKPPVDAQALPVKGPWASLLTAALKDDDGWYAPDNIMFFSHLYGLFDDFDTELKKMINEQAISGELQVFSGHEDLIEKVFSRASVQNGPACCATYPAHLELADLWQLYRNHGIANILRDLNRSINVHNSYAGPRKVAERMEPWFLGQPSFLRLYAEALKGDARNKQGTEKHYLLEQAYKMANDAGIYAATINSDTLRADKLLRQVMPYLPASAQRNPQPEFSIQLMGDLPSSRQYGGSGGGIDILNFSNSRFDGLERAYKTGALDSAGVKAELNTRFNGHPDKTVFRAKRLVRSGDTAQAVSLLRKETASESDIWKNYDYLSKLLIEDSDYSDAGKTCMQYPGFKTIPEGKYVETSNRATTCGNRLFWLGHFAEAEPLYKLAASLNTGSGSQYKAAQRLSLHENDFRNALRYAYRRGQRYNSRYGFRDYLIYLHLLGFHDDAENGFRGLVPRFDSPPIWTSIFVGQRMQDRTFSDIKEWTRNFLAQTTGKDNLDAQAERYIMLQAVVDRPVDQSSLDAVARFTPPSKQPKHTVRRPEFYIALYQGESASSEPESRSNPANESSADLYAGFMQAYVPLKAHKYDEALKAFLAYDTYHNFAKLTNKSSFALPYAAMAAAKSSPVEKLSDLLAMIEKRPGEERFDADLARSVIFAGQGHTDQALAALTDAFHHRPHTMWRPIYSWYQLTETAEWLYEATGDERFIAHALLWARNYQQIQPQFGWAYAFEALYSNNKADRVKAAGYANYLDSGSEWLQRVPEAIRKQGASWWDENNPYEEIKKGLMKQEQIEKSA